MNTITQSTTDEIRVRFARESADFSQAARYMRSAARSCRDQIRLDAADAMLARLCTAGSTPASGGLFLARSGGALVGFALLGRAANHALDVIWMHAGDGPRPAVARALQREVTRLEAEWDVAVPERPARARRIET